jgi:hypothetical protein
MNWLESLSGLLGLGRFADFFKQADGGDGSLELLLVLLAASAVGAAFAALNGRARAWFWRTVAVLLGIRRALRYQAHWLAPAREFKTQGELKWHWPFAPACQPPLRSSRRRN